MEKEKFKEGDTICYKRNGSYGSYNGVFIKLLSCNKKARIKIHAWCGSPLKKPYEANVSIKRISKLNP